MIKAFDMSTSAINIVVAKRMAKEVSFGSYKDSEAYKYVLQPLVALKLAAGVGDKRLALSIFF